MVDDLIDVSMIHLQSFKPSFIDHQFKSSFIDHHSSDDRRSIIVHRSSFIVHL